MSYQECLVFIAYLKYLKTQDETQVKKGLGAADIKAAHRKLSCRDKPHRTPPPPRPHRKPKFTLKELLAQMPDADGHSEIDTGPPVGNEVW